MITEEDFRAFIEVRDSGVTNMLDTKTVSALSGLDRDQILDIITNFEVLRERYGVG